MEGGNCRGNTGSISWRGKRARGLFRQRGWAALPAGGSVDPSPCMGVDAVCHGGPGGAAGHTQVELGLEVEPK